MTTLVHDAKPDRRIDALYAWVIVDRETGLESIAAFGGFDGMMPMQAVTSDIAVAKRTKPILEQILSRTNSNYSLRLLEFSGKVEVPT